MHRLTLLHGERPRCPPFTRGQAKNGRWAMGDGRWAMGEEWAMGRTDSRWTDWTNGMLTHPLGGRFNATASRPTSGARWPGLSHPERGPRCDSPGRGRARGGKVAQVGIGSVRWPCTGNEGQATRGRPGFRQREVELQRASRAKRGGGGESAVAWAAPGACSGFRLRGTLHGPIQRPREAC
jgi:hypothetical protein